MKRQKRTELDVLSKYVYGVPSRWHSFLKGQKFSRFQVQVTKKDNTIRKIPVTEIMYPTVEEIENKMLELKAAKDASKQDKRT